MQAQMNTSFSLWLRDKWATGDQTGEQLASDYRATFTTQAGWRVLQHMLSEIYCQVIEPGSSDSIDPLVLATQNGRRIVIHEILDNISLAEQIETKPLPEEEPNGS